MEPVGNGNEFCGTLQAAPASRSAKDETVCVITVLVDKNSVDCYDHLLLNRSFKTYRNSLARILGTRGVKAI